MIFFLEVACFFVERLRDFFCGELHDFYAERMRDFFVETLHKYFVWRGCMIFVTPSLTQVARFIFVKIA